MKRTTTSIQYSPRVATIWTSLTGPISVPARIASLTSDSLKARNIVYPQHKCDFSPFIFSIRLYLVVFPAETKYWKEAFSHNCVIWTLFSRTRKLLCPSLSPGAWVCGEPFHFFWLHNNQHFTVHRNCIWSFLFSLQAELWTPIFVAAPWIRSWVAECIVSNNSSVFVDSLLKWMVLFFCLRFRTPRFKALVPVKIGCLVSLNCCTILFSVRSHCPCCSWESPYHVVPEPGSRNVQCPGRNCYA